VYLSVRECVLIGVVNLADWAESVGVNRHTAYRWFREGTLPVPAERVGRLILVKTTAASASASVWWCMRGCPRMISARIWTAR